MRLDLHNAPVDLWCAHHASWFTQHSFLGCFCMQKADGLQHGLWLARRQQLSSSWCEHHWWLRDQAEWTRLYLVELDFSTRSSSITLYLSFVFGKGEGFGASLHASLVASNFKRKQIFVETISLLRSYFMPRFFFSFGPYSLFPWLVLQINTDISFFTKITVSFHFLGLSILQDC